MWFQPLTHLTVDFICSSNELEYQGHFLTKLRFSFKADANVFKLIVISKPISILDEENLLYIILHLSELVALHRFLLL